MPTKKPRRPSRQVLALQAEVTRLHERLHENDAFCAAANADCVEKMHRLDALEAKSRDHAALLKQLEEALTAARDGSSAMQRDFDALYEHVTAAWVHVIDARFATASKARGVAFDAARAEIENARTIASRRRST